MPDLVLPLAAAGSVDLVSLVWIMLVAVLAPLILQVMPKPGPPAVALLILGGMIIGPQVLGLAVPDAGITLLSNLGLGFLMFLAGYELDFAVFRQSEGKLAVWNWITAITLAVGIALLLSRFTSIKDVTVVAIALSSTSLGTLIPILRDSGQTGGPFGRAVIANGAIGEFGPILAISLLLGAYSGIEALLVILAFVLVAIAVAVVPRALGRRFPGIVEAIRSGWMTTAQTAVRITVLLLVVLLVIAEDFGLDIVLGAFAAGLVVRAWLPAEGRDQWEFKVNAMAYGIFIPVFFVCSGITLDVMSIIRNPVLLLAFLALFVIARGLPTLFWFRNYFTGPDAQAQPFRLMLYTCTSLPIIVAVTQIAVQANLLTSSAAAALVGAGVLTVLAFPLTAELMNKEPAVAASGPAAGDTPGNAAADAAGDADSSTSTVPAAADEASTDDGVGS